MTRFPVLPAAALAVCLALFQLPSRSTVAEGDAIYGFDETPLASVDIQLSEGRVDR